MSPVCFGDQVEMPYIFPSLPLALVLFSPSPGSVYPHFRPKCKQRKSPSFFPCTPFFSFFDFFLLVLRLIIYFQSFFARVPAFLFRALVLLCSAQIVAIVFRFPTYHVYLICSLLFSLSFPRMSDSFPCPRDYVFLKPQLPVQKLGPFIFCLFIPITASLLPHDLPPPKSLLLTPESIGVPGGTPDRCITRFLHFSVESGTLRRAPFQFLLFL